jgi:large subunit ribosomal protein L9
MEVILRDHVENVGKRGEVVKVADGYARNFLLPRKLALPATPGNRKHIDRERVKLDQLEAHEKVAAEAVASRMSGVEVVITRKVGETDALFGSVTASDIADALGTLGFETDRRKLSLREPIKKLGSYSVPLKLHREVSVTIPVRVVGEGRPDTAAPKADSAPKTEPAPAE